MQQYRLTVLAEADLDGIGEYSLERWGENQAVVYLTKLDETFSTLAHPPSIGRDRCDLRPGLLSCPCQRHVIFFRRDEGGNVEILRILHERMDFKRHV